MTIFGMVVKHEQVTPMARLALQLGVPSVIALWLVYVVSASQAQALHDHVRETRMEQSRLSALLLQVCINTSNTDIARDKCVAAISQQGR